MDANRTLYHLIYGLHDWGACLPDEEGTQTLSELWQVTDLSPLAGYDPEEFPVDWDRVRSEVTLAARIFQFNRAPRDNAPHLADRRGAATDAFGNLYWISAEEHSIRVRSAGSELESLFWDTAAQTPGSGLPAEPKPGHGSFQARTAEQVKPLRLRGLAVTAEHYLVVGILDPPGLLIFDLHGGGAPQQMLWPAPPAGGAPFTPFDMAARQDGGVWILDRTLDSPAVARLWSLDRHLKVLNLASVPVPAADTPLDFQPLLPESPIDGPVCPPAPQLTYDAAIVLREGDPSGVDGLVAVEALPDQSALILDNALPAGPWIFSSILRFSPSGELTGSLSTDVLKVRMDPDLEGFSLLGHDFVFLPEQPDNTDDPAEPGNIWGTLYVVQQDGNQAYAFSLFPAGGSPVNGLEPLLLQSEPLYLPMRLFAGRGLVAGQTRAFYDSGLDPVNWVPLVEQKRPSYVPQADLFTSLRLSPAAPASLRSALDGGRPDCIWHRLMIEGCLPSGTALQVWSRAANTESDLALCPWRAEPQPYRRPNGSELPFFDPAQITGSDAGTGQRTYSTWELLFQAARGRYLQIHLRLSSDGRSTPRLSAMRIYYPRFSYLEHYLPAVYRQEQESAHFLDRYLANMEGLYTTLEDRIANVQLLFDERTTPAEYLDWLAVWFGAQFEDGWDEQRKRLFLAHAAELYSQRGTPLGVVRMIRLATDECPGEQIFTDSLEISHGGRPSPIRVIETFHTRSVPAVIFGDPTQPEGPGFSLEEPDQPWGPKQGAAALHARFRADLQDPGRYPDLAALNLAWNTTFQDWAEINVSVLQPEQPTQAEDWQRFLRDNLNFPYVYPEADDLALFHSFLARRYGYFGALQDAYEDTAVDELKRFEDMGFPEQLPQGGAALYDWIEFVSIVLPTRRTAHHFTVLIPTRTGNQTEQSSQLAERAFRVVALEKPAHTTFTVKEYWALFRIGEARLGFDTQLDLGSRLAPVVLDDSYLAQSYLTFAHPWSAANRVVLGRDALGPSSRPRQQSKEE